MSTSQADEEVRKNDLLLDVSSSIVQVAESAPDSTKPNHKWSSVLVIANPWLSALL